jgi:hypothetical protein
MKKLLMPEAKKFGLMEFDVRTKEQKADDERREETHRNSILRDLCPGMTVKRFMRRSGQSTSCILRKDIACPTLASERSETLKIPKPGLGYWAKKAVGKPIRTDPRFRNYLREESMLHARLEDVLSVGYL